MSSNAVYVPPAKRAAAAQAGPRTLLTPPSPVVHTSSAPRLTLNTTALGRRGHRGFSPQSSISSTAGTPFTAFSSRPSSRSSDYSDSNSLFSAVSAASSATSFASSPIACSPVKGATRIAQEKENQKLWVDAGHKEVTGYLYQGGKTNVLGGGVMLGSPTTQAKPRFAGSSPRNARSNALFSALQPRLARA